MLYDLLFLFLFCFCVLIVSPFLLENISAGAADVSGQ